MFQNIKNNQFLFFLLKAGILYLSFYCFYEFYIKKYTSIDQLFIRQIINTCISLFHFFGYNTFASPETNDYQVFGIDGSNGVWIGGGCNGITLISLFAVFVIAYPGKIKRKLWYIPLGILSIHIINVVRIIALALMAYYAPSYIDFNHTYTFTFLAYTFVFSLWMLWANKLSQLK